MSAGLDRVNWTQQVQRFDGGDTFTFDVCGSAVVDTFTLDGEDTTVVVTQLPRGVDIVAAAEVIHERLVAEHGATVVHVQHLPGVPLHVVMPGLTGMQWFDISGPASIYKTLRCALLVLDVEGTP